MAKLDVRMRQRIVDELNLLVTRSRVDSRKLEGSNEYRLRVGTYRVMYGIDRANKVFVVLKIADRKNSYR